LIADVRKFNSILDELSLDTEISAGILKKLRAIQIEIAHWAAGHQGDSKEFESELAKLSDRELEVLVHVAQGRSSKEVGHILSLSEHTVKRHLDNVYRKTELKKRSDVIAAAIAINNIQVTRMGH
jgi:DNA-binding CsgD family transcriptional regulator